MSPLHSYVLVLVTSLTLLACQQGPTVSTTNGSATVECDESLLPIMKFQAEDFHSTYPDASIRIRPVEAREAVVDFVNDSVRVIIMGRQFNPEELSYIGKAGIDYQGFKVALDAIAVIGNRARKDSTLRITELDSIYSGLRTRWGGTTSPVIDAYIADINSSTDEVFRNEILQGKPVGPTVIRVKTSSDLIEKVKANRNAIGLIGLSWLYGNEDSVRVFRVGGGSYRPVMTATATIEGTKNNDQRIVFTQPPGQMERDEFFGRLKQTADQLKAGSISRIWDESQGALTRIVVALEPNADADHVLRTLSKGTAMTDTTLVAGQFFSPAQAHVFRRYYPMSRDVYMYTREPRRDVSYGFIAFVKDKKGQQNFVNQGLVPAAMPVRIVTTTTDKVHEQ